MTSKMNEWMENAWNFQQEMFKMFGKRRWDNLNGSEDNLRKKLIVPFEYRFGKTYRSNPQFKKITDHVETQILKLFHDKSFNQNFDVTFINLMKKDDEVDEQLITCLFWLQSKSGSERCVDLDGRDYKSWDDFIKNNILSKYYMIYPKSGIYCQPCNIYFADIILDESVACGARRILKNVLNVITTVGGVAATGVLVFNPVSGPIILGATAVAAVSGVYGAGTNINRLVDIHKHEGGLSLKESKTLLTAGELVINVAGTAAVGLSAGIKGLTTTTGKALSEGSIAFKVANSFSKVAKVVSYFNAGFSFVVAMNNLSIEGVLSETDLADIKKTLFYGFNVEASDLLITKLISFLVANIPVERVIDYFMISVARRATELVRMFKKFYSEIDFSRLIDLILPNCFKLLNPSLEIEKISIAVRTSIEKFTSWFERDFSFFKSEDEDEIKRKGNEGYTQRKFDAETYNIIKKWTESNGIDLFVDSRFASNIYTLEELRERIKETVKMCYKTAALNNLKEKEYQLLMLCLNQIKSDKELKPAIIKRMNFYCIAFELFYNDLIKSYYYKYFYFYHKKNNNMDKHEFFSKYYSAPNIYDYAFNNAHLAFINDLHNLHEKSEQF